MSTNNIFPLLSNNIKKDKKELYKNYVYLPGTKQEQQGNDVDRVNNIIGTNNKIEMYTEQLQEMCHPKRCIKCGKTYTETQNFKWQCNYHPKGIDQDNQIYKCCGWSVKPNGKGYQRKTFRGCRGRDHVGNKHQFDENGVESIPMILVEKEIIRLRKDGKNIVKVVKNVPEPYYLVARYEK